MVDHPPAPAILVPVLAGDPGALGIVVGVDVADALEEVAVEDVEHPSST